MSKCCTCTFTPIWRVTLFDPRPLPLKTLHRHVGVVVATHNRADYLPVCLRHILDQTHKPERIVVVDDGSTDDTADVVARFPVEYERVDLGGGYQCAPAKRYGFERLYELPYLCCIDSDDWPDPDYLEKLLDCMESDSRVGVAYPRLQQFGARQSLFDRQYDADMVARTNTAPSTSLMRTDALKQIGGWPVVRWTEHEDWAAWRRMRSHGWLLKQGDTTYHWRRHADSQTYKFRGSCDCGSPEVKTDHNVHWINTVDKQDLITVAVPFSGRATVAPFLRALEKQSFPRGLVHLLFFDNSVDQEFGDLLKTWLSQCDYGSYTYFPYRVRATATQSNHATADGDRRVNADEVNDRCAGNWGRIAQLVHTDLVWCLEDDVIPPPNCLDRLTRAFRPEVDAVSALYAGRNSRWVVRDFSSLSPLLVHEKHIAGGIEIADAVGFGCVLMRRQLLQSIPMRSAGDGGDGSTWYDVNFWADAARQGAIVKVDGDVVCEHLVS